MEDQALTIHFTNFDIKGKEQSSKFKTLKSKKLRPEVRFQEQRMCRNTAKRARRYQKLNFYKISNNVSIAFYLLIVHLTHIASVQIS